MSSSHVDDVDVAFRSGTVDGAHIEKRRVADLERFTKNLCISSRGLLDENTLGPCVLGFLSNRFQSRSCLQRDVGVCI